MSISNLYENLAILLFLFYIYFSLLRCSLWFTIAFGSYMEYDATKLKALKYISRFNQIFRLFKTVNYRYLITKKRNEAFC